MMGWLRRQFAPPAFEDDEQTHLLAESNQELVAEVAERRRVAEALRKSEERYRTILESIEDGYYETDLAGNLTFFNDALCEIIGYPRVELLGLNNRQYMDEENARRVYQTFNRVYRTGQPSSGFDWELIGKEGTRRCVEASVSLVRDAGGLPLGFRGIARDVTARKRAEEALRESEERWRMYVEQANDLIFSLDTSGRFTAVNRAACQVTGYTAEELLGRYALDLVPPDTRSAAAGMLATIMGGDDIDQAELQVLTKAGRLIFLEVRGRFIYEQGEFVGTFHIARDITERKQAEEALRAWAAELEARNVELDAFAHTVAHDLQDPVGVIVGYADLLAEEFAHLPERGMRRGLDAIEQSARKMNNIINELLLLAEIRKRAVQSTALDMGCIVAGACERLVHLAEERQAQIVVAEAWPAALGYAPWVEEVWVNYLSNALKYGGCPPRIELGADAPAVGEVRFWIRDWGPGLTPEQQVGLFVPFTQLSQVHTGGYGLGLSIVRRIVQKLGGDVGVESEGLPGRGSLFYFILPAAGEGG